MGMVFDVYSYYSCEISNIYGLCLSLQRLVCDLCNVKMEGYEEFEERRKKKVDKQIDLNVMISSKGLDVGVDKWLLYSCFNISLLRKLV